MWGVFRALKGDRSDRISANIPINFRRTDDFAWMPGRIKNVSRSGVLFETSQPVPMKTRVEMQFVAPHELGREAGELISCQGKVVRTLSPPDRGMRPLLAAEFTSYHVAGSKTVG
jgi:hypothetical protein